MTAAILLALADRLSESRNSSEAHEREISETIGVKVGPLWTRYTDHALALLPDAVRSSNHEIQIVVTPDASHVVRIVWGGQECGHQWQGDRVRLGEHRSLPMAVCIAAIRVRAAVVGGAP